MFKGDKNLAPPQMHGIFKLKDKPYYNLRFAGPLLSQTIKTRKVYCFKDEKSGKYYGIPKRICLI